ncbi:MAG: hypothetical protein RR614_02970 [Eubacterium sp.]
MAGLKIHAKVDLIVGGAYTSDGALSITAEMAELRKQIKEQNKEIKRLKEENKFLEEASAFFTASCLKSTKAHE